MDLITTNRKLEKCGRLAFHAGGLCLAPHASSRLVASPGALAASWSAGVRETTGGFVNLCEHATAGCIAGCLIGHSGQTVTPIADEARRKRTALLLTDPVAFYDQLHREIGLHVRRAEKLGVRPLVRLNLGSDLDWLHVIAQWPAVQFIDYTKHASRCLGALPDNYQVTYSVNERSESGIVRRILKRGGNVAVCFNVEWCPQHGRIGRLPARFLGARVIDGDTHDVRLRSVDGRGVVVGLRLKGGLRSKAAAIKTGFSVSPTDKRCS